MFGQSGTEVAYQEQKTSTVVYSAPMGGEADVGGGGNAMWGGDAKMALDLDGVSNGPVNNNELPSFEDSGNGVSIVKVSAGVLVLIVLGILGLSYYVGGTLDPLKNLAALWDKILPYFTSSDDIAAVAGGSTEGGEADKLNVKPATAPVVEKPKFEASMAANPYWFLPNPLRAEALEGDDISGDSEERWRVGLGHQFAFQRYLTAKEIRASHAKGSEDLLMETLDQAKFWTRMEGILGLIELGKEVDVDDVQKAIGSARPSLVKNYFYRFEHHATPYEVYLMKQAVRVANSMTRFVILKNLYTAGDRDLELYVTAATFDPNTKIRTWAQTQPVAYMITDHQLMRFQQLVAESWTKASTEQAEPVAKSQPVATVKHEPSHGFDTETIISNVKALFGRGETKTSQARNVDDSTADKSADRPAEHERHAKDNKHKGMKHLDEIKPEAEAKGDDGFDSLKAKSVTFEQENAGKGDNQNQNTMAK